MIMILATQLIFNLATSSHLENFNVLRNVIIKFYTLLNNKKVIPV